MLNLVLSVMKLGLFGECELLPIVLNTLMVCNSVV